MFAILFPSAFALQDSLFRAAGLTVALAVVQSSPTPAAVTTEDVFAVLAEEMAAERLASVSAEVR